MQRIAEAWGDHICGTVAAFVSPASLQYGDTEVARYVGYGALAALVIVAASLVVKVLSRYAAERSTQLPPSRIRKFG